MPLSRPTSRRLLHTREITCRGFERDDGLWDIEAELLDTKTYSFDNIDRGGVAAGEAVHNMLIRLTVNDALSVTAAEASTEAGPFFGCHDVAPRFADLVGLKIAPGWRQAVHARFGRRKGCTHLTDLLTGPMAVAAFHTVRTGRAWRDANSSGRPALLDSCHAYRSDGPVIARQWPEFYDGPDPGKDD